MSSLRTTVVAVGITLAITGTAKAQAMVDMSKMTCEQLLTASPNAIDAAVWLSGYYNGVHKNTMLDLNQFKRNAEVVVDECRTNPKKTLMSTVGKLLSGK
jgi:hypothetical protein